MIHAAIMHTRTIGNFCHFKRFLYIELQIQAHEFTLVIV